MLKILVLFLFSSISFAEPIGALNPAVTQATLGYTVCVPNWTATIRPPSSYTNKLKVLQIKQLGLLDTSPQSYEEDHFIPLSIGGHPTSPKNLWPEPWVGVCGAKVKDALESKLHTMVCTKKISLVTAQLEISHNWVSSYNKRVGKLVCK